MKKILLIMVIMLLANTASAATYYSWRYLSSADCQAEATGKLRDLCFDTVKERVFKCVPTAGDCDTAGEWIDSSGIDEADALDWTGDHTFATTATFNSDIKSGTKLIKPDKPIAMFTITNGDTAIDASVVDPVACVMIENDSIITEWTVIADKTGSIELDIWKDTYANHPPTVGDSIVGTEAPTISAGVKAEDTSLTSMTTDWNAGDVVCCAITSASTMTKATVQFRGYND